MVSGSARGRHRGCAPARPAPYRRQPGGDARRSAAGRRPPARTQQREYDHALRPCRGPRDRSRSRTGRASDCRPDCELVKCKRRAVTLLAPERQSPMRHPMALGDFLYGRRPLKTQSYSKSKTAVLSARSSAVHPTSVGVDPLSWIPNPLASGKENPRCHEPTCRTRPSFATRWWSWPARDGRSESSHASFECSDQTIRNRVRQADLDEGRRDDGLTSAEREALRRLRRENRRLREEREILARAAAWFAREADSVPARRSSS